MGLEKSWTIPNGGDHPTLSRCTSPIYPYWELQWYFQISLFRFRITSKMGLGTSWMKSIGGGHPTPSSCSNTILGIAGATGRISSQDHDIQNPLEKPILKQVKSSKSIFGPISLSPIGCLLWVNQAPHHVGNTRFGISSKRRFRWYIKLSFWVTSYHHQERPPYTL